MGLTYGVAALGRPTFDVPFAEKMLADAFAALKRAGITVVGPEKLLYDADAAEEALAEIDAHDKVDALLLIQITFTDATMTVRFAKRTNAPIAIWATPEPRLGGRLRLNAFCGLNLASHALGKADIAHGWLYATPDAPNIEDDLRALATPTSPSPSKAKRHTAEKDEQAEAALGKLRGSKISVIGEHPAGFDTCEYDARELNGLADINVETFTLKDVFAQAEAMDETRVAEVKAKVADDLAGLNEVDQEQLDRSFRLFCALEDVQQNSNANGLAVRCWPETFTEYGCAACGPMAMMNQKCVPSACEADVYGSFSALLLQADRQMNRSGWRIWWISTSTTTPASSGIAGWRRSSMCDPEASAGSDNPHQP